MLLPVITRVSSDTGIDLTQDRKVLVALYNSACRVFHHELEANRMFREVTLKVPPDKIISLPSFIGEVKGLRVHTTEMIVPLLSLNVPRYTNSTLLYKIKNWRDLGDSAIMRNLTVVGQLTLSTDAVQDPPVTVKIKGQTSSASVIEEEVVMSDTTVSTVNQFGPRIDSIVSFDSRNTDITITDQNDTMIALLYNKDQKTRYKIMDVSQIFWPMSDTAEGDSYIDLCYKVPFILGKNDTDSFAGGDDYDDAIYHMMMHLNLLGQPGKEQAAALELVRATQVIKAIKDGTETGIKKKLNFGRNKFYGLFTRGRHRLSGNDYGMYLADFGE